MTEPERVPSAEEVVAAIWNRWDERLDDWDLEGGTANGDARALAVEAVRDLLAPARVLPRPDTP